MDAIRVKCDKCRKRFSIHDTHIKARGAKCPFCGAVNTIGVSGRSVQVKIIRNRLIEPVKGSNVYCAKCMKVVTMPHSLPRCPDCNSRNIFTIVTNYTLPCPFYERFEEDNNLWLVACLTNGWGIPVRVVMPLRDVRELDEDADEQTGGRLDV
jgi:Zn finger protein HypA/HybF involved in hydrogenase expression